MGHRREFLLSIFVIISVGFGAVVVLGWLFSYKENKKISQTGFFVDQDLVTGIKGKLLKNERILQAESDYVDLYYCKDVIIALLQPYQQTDFTKDDNIDLCELVIELNGIPEKTITVSSLGGNGKMMTETDGPFTFIRLGQQFPRDRNGMHFIDEAGILAYLIEAICEKDKIKINKYENLLRESMGLATNPPPNGDGER